MAEKKVKKAAPKKTTTTESKVEKKVTTSTESKTKKFQDFVIHTKRSGRFEVIDKCGKNVNGMEKAKILVDAKLIKTGLSKKPATESAPSGEEAPAT